MRVRIVICGGFLSVALFAATGRAAWAGCMPCDPAIWANLKVYVAGTQCPQQPEAGHETITVYVCQEVKYCAYHGDADSYDPQGECGDLPDTTVIEQWYVDGQPVSQPTSSWCAPGTHTVYFRADDSGTQYGCPDENEGPVNSNAVTITVVTPSVTVKPVSFTGDSQMYENSTDHGGWGAGAAISDPVWTSTGRNKPASYVKGSHVSMTAQFDVSPVPSPAIQATIKLDGPGTLDGETTVTLNSSTVTATITTTGTLDSKVYKVGPSPFYWSWRCSTACGYTSAGQSQHRIYVTWATPNQGTNNELTENRIAWCTTGANNAATALAVADSLWNQTANGNPSPVDDYGDWDPPYWYELERTRGASCDEQAELMRCALRLEGLNGEAYLVLASTDISPCSMAKANWPTNLESDTNCPVHPGSTEYLYFHGNRFEGVCRFADGSGDDGYKWYAIWPKKAASKDCGILCWYGGSYPQFRTIDSPWFECRSQALPAQCSQPGSGCGTE